MKHGELVTKVIFSCRTLPFPAGIACSNRLSGQNYSQSKLWSQDWVWNCCRLVVSKSSSPFATTFFERIPSLIYFFVAFPTLSTVLRTQLLLILSLEDKKSCFTRFRYTTNGLWYYPCPNGSIWPYNRWNNIAVQSSALGSLAAKLEDLLSSSHDIADTPLSL